MDEEEHNRSFIEDVAAVAETSNTMITKDTEEKQSDDGGGGGSKAFQPHII
jgi:hypothetical protein